MPNENKPSETSRRRVLKSLGVGTALSISVASFATTGAVAKDAEDQTTAREIGIADKVRFLLKQGKRTQALRLLSKHDVPHTSKTYRMPAIGSAESSPQTDDPTLTPQSEWDIRYSTYEFSAYLISGDIYDTYSNWDLNGAGPYETSGPNDAIGVTVSQDLWEPVLDSELTDSRTTLETVGPQGVIFRFNDPDGPVSVEDANTTGYAFQKFEKLESGTFNIYSSYVHNWCPAALCGSIGFSLQVPYIGFSITGRVDTWEKHTNLEI